MLWCNSCYLESQDKIPPGLPNTGNPAAACYWFTFSVFTCSSRRNAWELRQPVRGLRCSAGSACRSSRWQCRWQLPTALHLLHRCWRKLHQRRMADPVPSPRFLLLMNLRSEQWWHWQHSHCWQEAISWFVNVKKISDKVQNWIFFLEAGSFDLPLFIY